MKVQSRGLLSSYTLFYLDGFGVVEGKKWKEVVEEIERTWERASERARIKNAGEERGIKGK